MKALASCVFMVALGQPVLAQTEHALPLIMAASNRAQQGWVRIINHSNRAGTVQIVAVDDYGERFGPVYVSLGAKETVNFNSTDLEEGSAFLSGGVGNGEGNWHLQITTELNIEPLAYVRTLDGSVTSLHDVAREISPQRYYVPLFDASSQSHLRLINSVDIEVMVKISGLDDQGELSPEGEARLTLPPRAACTVSALELESGEIQGQCLSASSGSLGDGTGKWHLLVSADRPIQVMSLMLGPWGHLTNPSTSTLFHAKTFNRPASTRTCAIERNIAIGFSSEALQPSNYVSVGIEFSELSPNFRLSDSANHFRPRRDVPTWNASLPIYWSADPFEDRNWQFQLHAWRVMDFHLNQYRETDDATWLQGAVEIALDWDCYHVGLGDGSAYVWHDMAAGLRSFRLAFLLDPILSGQLDIDDANLAALMRLVDLHAEKLQEPEFLSSGNHAFFQLAGLNALCEVVSWRTACRQAHSYARTAFTQLIRTQFTDEGVHTESSPAYHRFVLQVLRNIRAAERFSHTDATRILERAEKVTPWLTYPNGDIIAVGDSAGTGPVLKAPVEPVCLSDTSCWAVQDLTDSGYAVIRSLPETPLDEASLLFVSAMAHLTGHKHADDLGFVLMEGGRKVFVDSGKYGYNHDEERRYVISARAHNVPSLADRTIGPKDLEVESAHVGPIRVNGSEFMIHGAVDRPGLFRHERTFLYAPGASLRIKDRLYNRTNKPWLSNLHLAVSLVPEIHGSGFTVRVGNRIVHAEFKGLGCELILTEGETESFQGWVSTGYLKLTPSSVVSASCPAGLVESEWIIRTET